MSGRLADVKHERVVVRFRPLLTRARPAIWRVLTAALLLVGAHFMLDAAWFATGEFLVPG